MDDGVTKGAVDVGVQDVTRPSELVVAVKECGDVDSESLRVLGFGNLYTWTVISRCSFQPVMSQVGEKKRTYSVSVTGISFPGFPIVVSSTWHVIGGFCSVAMVFATTSGLGDDERCDEIAAMRAEAGSGMRVC